MMDTSGSPVVEKGSRFPQATTTFESRYRVRSIGMTPTGYGSVFPLAVGPQGVLETVATGAGEVEVVAEIDVESLELANDPALMRALQEAAEDLRSGRIIRGDDLRGQ